jgi:diacylglycerol kinase
VAAGSVLLLTIIAVIMGLLIFLPPLVEKLP